MTQRAFIVDDEPLARNELAFLLNRDHAGSIEIVGEAASGPEALAAMPQIQPDILFLDVKMPGMSGLEVLDRLRREMSELLPQIVFTTAFEDYACKAFDVGALDYLMKPIAPDRLALTVERLKHTPLEAAVAKRTVPRSLLSVRKGNRILVKSPKDICFAEIQDGLVFVVDGEGTYLTNHRTLEDLQAELDPEMFFRAHRGFLVNLRKIRELVPSAGGLFTLIMAPVRFSASQSRANLDATGQFAIPVSRVQARKLRRVLNF